MWRLSASVAVVLATLVAGIPAVRARQNLEILATAPPEQLERIMQAISVSLGVECEHCHVAGAYALDDLEPKETARRMMRMVEHLDATTFEVLESPSCWTCHRGTQEPPSEPPPLGELPLVPVAPFSDSTEPAGEVYENIVTLRTLPANQLRTVMGAYSRALGVGCDHCHVPGDWSSDREIVKQLTRVMIDMQETLRTGFFDGREVVSCWTCHRGDVTPQSSLPGQWSDRFRQRP